MTDKIDNDNKTKKGSADKIEASASQSANKHTSVLDSSTKSKRRKLLGDKVRPSEKDIANKRDDQQEQHHIHWRQKPLDGYLVALQRLGIQYREHAFLGTQVSFDGGDNWVAWSDNLEAEIYVRVQTHCRYVFYKGKKDTIVKPVITSASDRDTVVKSQLQRNYFHPLVKYFNDIPLLSESPSVIPNLLTACFSVETPSAVVSMFGSQHEADTAMCRFIDDVMLLIGVGIYRRTMTPGSNFPFFPVIISDQGVGKSLWIKNLIPPSLRATTDSLDMTLDTKDRLATCQQASIVECAELAGHSKRDVADLKNFISGNDTSVRMSYARRPQRILRHFVVIGTTNDQQFLSLDPSGDRRHIPIPVKINNDWKPTDVEKLLPSTMNELRDEFWSAIKYLVETENRQPSYANWCPSSIAIRETMITETTRRNYPLEVAIDILFDDNACDDGSNHLTTAEVANGIAFDVPANCDRRSIMKLLPRDISGRYTPDYICKVLSKKGIVTIKRIKINGAWVSIKGRKQS